MAAFDFRTLRALVARRRRMRVAAARAGVGAGRRLPLSGSEPVYTDLVYGSPRGVKNNNCYAWAIGDYKNSGSKKLQPGNLVGETRNMNLSNCSELRARVQRDLGARVYPEQADAPCRKGYYKVMAFLDENNDYHWYKQHSDMLVRAKAGNSASLIARNLDVPVSSVLSPESPSANGDLVLVKGAGLWSHKQGFATGPLIRDACDKPIRDPRTACRDYGKFNYRTFCGAFCVRDPDAGKN